ncbi:uncharacterized protein LOC134530061 [Bacillus rossius redtenbacheri]|uniref:uncharacterized protein LOC134530061 n=1 Tax=Bacillus rossius redtenbacheri TaxID=93214 RepID=UPI002FDE4B3C
MSQYSRSSRTRSSARYTSSTRHPQERDVEHSSISSEEEAGSGSDSEVRTRVVGASAQEIWPRDQVTDQLRSLPGGEELWGLLELGDASSITAHPHALSTGLLIAAWTGNQPALAAVLDAGSSPNTTDMLGR